MLRPITLAAAIILLALSAHAAEPSMPTDMPRYILQPEPIYPAEMWAQNIQGSVVLRILIGRNGFPADVRIKQSSGHGPLDNAAVRAARGAQWEPISEPIWVIVPMNFKLR